MIDHIDLNKYLTTKDRRTGRPRYDEVTLLKVILFMFMENGYESLRKIEKLCKTDDVVYTIESFFGKNFFRKFLNKGTDFANSVGFT